MNSGLLRQKPVHLWLAAVMLLSNACQLVSGVNDLRVEDEPESTVDDADDTRDAEPTDDSDDSDNTRSDAALADASADVSDQTSAETSADTTDDQTSRAEAGVTSGAASVDPEAGVTSGTSSVDPDAGPGCEIPGLLACAPITNCGCTQGTVCTLTREDDQLAVNCEQPGVAQLGAACEPGDCASGYHCWEGVCRQACQRDNDCEQEGASCDPLAVNGDDASKVRYCEAPCNFIAPTEPADSLHVCPEAQTCIRTATSSVCSSVVGLGGQGASCDHDVDCAAGYGCLNQVCKAWCDPANGDCGLWGECLELTDVAGAPGPIGACESTCEVSSVPGSTCGVLPNCGCADGQSCRVLDEGHAECSVVGVGGPQAACEDHFDCQADLACVAFLCRPYCDPLASDCAESSACVVVADGVGVCAGSCDAVWQSTEDENFTPCGEGALCLPGYTDTDIGVPFCAATGDATLIADGAQCDPETDWCFGGSICTGICEPLCRGASDCTLYETAEAQCLEPESIYLDNDASEFGVCCLPGPAENSECSAFGADCGCPDGEACRLFVDDEGNTDLAGRTVCTPAGDTTAQSLCEFDEDCIRGTSCIGGICRPHCDGTCAETQGSCVQIVVGELDVPNAQVCLGLCDPTDPTASTELVGGCGEGVKCIAGTIDDEVESPLSSCRASTNNLADGEACQYYEDCLPGSGCECFPECSCHKWCKSDDDCDGGTTCFMDIGRQISPDVLLGVCRE